MKLDAIETATFLLHRLDVTSLVCSSRAKTIRQFFHFVTVVVPNRDLGRQSFEETFASVFDWQKSTLTLRAVVTFTRFDPSHQSDLRAVRQRYLLMTTADSEDRLTRLLYNCEHAGQRFRRVHLPRMTLPAQYDVRRLQAAHSFERNLVEWLDENFEPGNEPAEHRPNFAWACSLAVDGVVYEVN